MIDGNKIDRISTSGVLTEFDIPTYYSRPLGIAAGPDGNMWFTENNFPHNEGNKIGRVTTSGEFTEFRIPTPKSRRFGITAGPDGNMWFTENAGNKIGRVTTGGTFSEFAIPTPSSFPPNRPRWTASSGCRLLGHGTRFHDERPVHYGMDVALEPERSRLERTYLVGDRRLVPNDLADEEIAAVEDVDVVVA